jgi:hypothetical protein
MMPDDMSGAQLTILITSVVGFLGTFFGFLGQWMIARRNRAWELENKRLEAEERAHEREELVKLAEAKAQALVIEAKAIADALSIKTIRSVAQLESSIRKVGAEAVDAAHKAYEEANHVNVKIAELNDRLLEQKERT